MSIFLFNMRIRLPFFASGHLIQPRRILDDLEASDNDRFPKCAFVIYSMLTTSQRRLNLKVGDRSSTSLWTLN